MNKFICPFNNCPDKRQKHKASFKSILNLRDHLESSHKSHIASIDKSWFTENNLFCCQTCKERIFLNKRYLGTHTVKEHQGANDTPNSVMLKNTFYTSDKPAFESKWKYAIPWIGLNLKPNPTSFRQTLWDKASPKHRRHLATIMLQLMENIPFASSRDEDIGTGIEWSATPWWWLIIHLEQLIFAPKPPKSNDSINKCITRRFAKFHCGLIAELHAEALMIESWSPSTKNSKPPSVSEKNVMAALDVDNLRSGYTRLCKEAPVETMHDDNIKIIEALFPPKLPLANTNNRIRTRKQSSTSPTPQKVVNIHNTILRQQQGKAPGLLNDSIDIFIYIAELISQKKLPNFNSTILDNALQFIMDGNLPPDIKPFFCDTYLVALRKDPTDHTKLRPIGIPSAIRRIIASYISQTNSSHFNSYLLPHNFAAGVKGGMEFLVSTIQQEYDNYIATPIKQNTCPTRAIVSIDIINMFNSISKERVREIIKEKFPHLSAVIDLLYKDDFNMYIKYHDNTWHTIPVKEGFTQGCPLSPILASLVLQDVLIAVDIVMKKQARDRLKDKNRYDDNLGGVCNILGWMDDVNCAIPIPDILLFMETFETEAKKVGAILNKTKTRIFTTNTGSSIIPLVEQTYGTEIAENLRQAINSYSTSVTTDDSGIPTILPVEVTDGIRVLGTPVGSSTFKRQFIFNILDTIHKDALTIISKIKCKQAALRLFSHCCITKIPHLLACVATCEINEKADQDWFSWTSPITTAINHIESWFLASIVNASSIPHHSLQFAQVAISNGGLGLLNPSTRIISDSIIKTINAIKFSNNGIMLAKDKPPFLLPISLRNLFTSWNSSTSEQFKIFQDYAPEIAEFVAPSRTTNKLEYMIHTSSTATIRNKCKDIANEMACRDLLEHKDNAVRSAAPGLLQPQTSYPFIATSRKNKSNHLPNETMVIGLRRKLRIPMWHKNCKLHCCCKRDGKHPRIDIYGDHFFSCKKHNKVVMHNSVRDASALPITRLLCDTNIIPSPSATAIEPEGIVSFESSLRPYDFCFHPDARCWAQDDAIIEAPTIGIDFTFAPPQPTIPPADAGALSIMEAHNRHLQRMEKKKLVSGRKVDESSVVRINGDTICEDLLEQGHILIPGVIDQFGGLGPTLQRFYFGSNPDPPPPSLFSPSQRNAEAMFHLANSNRCPSNIMQWAGDAWTKKKSEADNIWYGDSYLAPSPRIWALQQIGIGLVKSMAFHVKHANFEATSRRRFLKNNAQCWRAFKSFTSPHLPTPSSLFFSATYPFIEYDTAT